ncbi:hypothetical protein ACJ72_03493 [Emergomyces africanus]|uniref:Uncharacterized protein n=1 Tax=Emergomyces africanus TaxID=1955775 RepID=A0A1B7NZG2_9EURO|nr:hypothetical protein ACJ72_03493 [Emergomyces africanus]
MSEQDSTRTCEVQVSLSYIDKKISMRTPSQVLARDATVVLWDKSDGIPEWFWNEARSKRTVWIKIRGHLVAALMHRSPYWQYCFDALGLRHYYGESDDSSYMYEATHHLDRFFSKSATFLAAKAADTFWPTEYSKNGDGDLLAELGVAYLYDKSGKTLLERGYDASCLFHEFNVLGDYAGGDFRRTSKCFKRRESSRVIHPTDPKFASPEVYLSEAVIEHFPNTPPASWDWTQETNFHRGSL